MLPKDSPYEDLFSAKGEKWKRLGRVASPSFSTGRMKEVKTVLDIIIIYKMSFWNKRQQNIK